jgi:hypothetical protein
LQGRSGKDRENKRENAEHRARLIQNKRRGGTFETKCDEFQELRLSERQINSL